MLAQSSGYLPEFTVITDGKTSDIEIGRALAFQPAVSWAMDRGYRYEWFNQLTKQRYIFCCLKSNAAIQ